MPKTTKARVDQVARLAEELLRILESRRARGEEAYPPTLRQLAELCDGPPSREQVLKAVRKKVFTDRAAITEKIGKDPSYESPLYFKEDVPDPVAVLSARMLAVLESQRRLGGGAYPPTLSRLAELCGRKGSDTVVPKALDHASMSGRAIAAAVKGKQPIREAPVVFREDIEDGISTILPALLNFALGPAMSRSGGKNAETSAFTPDDLAKRLAEDLRKPIVAALEEGIARGGLPPGIAWVRLKGKPYLFLLENLRGAAAPQLPIPAAPADRHASPPFPAVDGTPAPATPAQPAREFDGAFREAFDRLDRRNGSTNFVKLSDLRRALPGFCREAFDAGLRSLRVAGLFSLDSHEGMHGPLSPEERDAGVHEAGSLLVYVSRR